MAEFEPDLGQQFEHFLHKNGLRVKIFNCISKTLRDLMRSATEDLIFASQIMKIISRQGANLPSFARLLPIAQVKIRF